jgi:hypothetical protein
MVLLFRLGFYIRVLGIQESQHHRETEQGFRYSSATLCMTFGHFLVELVARGAARDGLNGTWSCGLSCGIHKCEHTMFRKMPD